MWSTAAALRALEGLIPDAVRYEIDFAKPVVLPASVALFSSQDANGTWELQLRKASKLETLHANAKLEEL